MKSFYVSYVATCITGQKFGDIGTSFPGDVVTQRGLEDLKGKIADRLFLEKRIIVEDDNIVFLCIQEVFPEKSEEPE